PAPGASRHEHAAHELAASSKIKSFKLLPVPASRKLGAARQEGTDSKRLCTAPLAGDGEGRGGLRGCRRLGLLRPVLLLRGNQGHLPRV
uniref:Uncharacterized protein n=1 Tax=Aegilops tauschii subsp. strangulata TaxID=200361 RepID=A0A452YN76_AEGTS